MRRFDQEKMVQLTSELRKGVQRLSALSKLSEEEFTADPDKVGSAKYHLIVAIEICIDICTHLLSLSSPFDVGTLGGSALRVEPAGDPKLCLVRLEEIRTCPKKNDPKLIGAPRRTAGDYLLGPPPSSEAPKGESFRIEERNPKKEKDGSGSANGPAVKQLNRKKRRLKSSTRPVILFLEMAINMAIMFSEHLSCPRGYPQ